MGDMLQWRVWWGHVEGAAQGTPGGGAQRHDTGGAPDFFCSPGRPILGIIQILV